MLNEIETIIKRCEDLDTANSSWKSYWDELASFCMPRKAHINSTKQKGDRLDFGKLYDSTAIRSLKIMAAGFHSNLTNPSSKWFNLRTRNLTMMDNQDIQMWFKEVEDIIFATLASSNFDTTMQEFYLNSGCFGTGTILTLEDAKEKVRFTEIPIEQIAMEEDAYGRVNRMYRTFEYTVQQAFDLWGKNAGKAVTDRIEKKPNDSLKFLHFVGPRDKYNPSKRDGVNMPYRSVWIEKSEKHKIGEGGFEDFPYAVGRFYKDTNDVFGYSPAMDVLSDTKLVNAQTKTMLRAAMKQADPALILPRKGFVLPLNANPAATNYHDSNVKGEQIVQLPSGGDIPITLEVIQMVQQNIEKAFFVPLFQAISNITKQMTIPEVQRRVSENMVLLGPVVGRFTQEVLDPIIIRVFNILFRNGELPMPPEEIQDQELDVVYISALARAQKESGIFQLQAFMQDVGLIATAKPDTLDKIDGDKMVDEIARTRGISPELVLSNSDVQEIRTARAEAQAEANKMAAMGQMADMAQKGGAAAKSIAEAKNEGGSK